MARRRKATHAGYRTMPDWVGNPTFEVDPRLDRPNRRYEAYRAFREHTIKVSDHLKSEGRLHELPRIQDHYGIDLETFYAVADELSDS